MKRIGKDEALALVARSSELAEPAHGGCVMCALASRPDPIAANPAAVVVLERFATRRAHLVVVLRRHVERVAELPVQEYLEVQRLAWEAARALEVVVKPVRTFVAALGSAERRTNSFPHHHVHLIPLTDGGDDDRPAEVLTWSKGVYLYDPGESLALEADLRAAWPAL